MYLWMKGCTEFIHSVCLYTSAVLQIYISNINVIFFFVLSVVANGDVQNPAARLLIPSRVIGQFERILEMITEKMGLRIVGGVRR